MNGAIGPSRGDYEIVKAWEGFASIRQLSSGEIMHSRTDPMTEARELYVEQSRLAERLRENPTSEPLVLCDVGLGAAANATAAIECYELAMPARPLSISSFENDLDPLRLALENESQFPYLRSASIRALLADNCWQSEDLSGLRWRLVAGDFLETMHSVPAPDVIFYDMFSTKTSASLWSAAAFRELFDVCAGRAVEVFTYTCSTANRAALLAAGFFVAKGRNAGEKLETTIALTPAALDGRVGKEADLLGRDWLARWERSAAKVPRDISPQQVRAFEGKSPGIRNSLGRRGLLASAVGEKVKSEQERSCVNPV
jgi:queuine tRNA-ribosyltransferase